MRSSRKDGGFACNGWKTRDFGDGAHEVKEGLYEGRRVHVCFEGTDECAIFVFVVESVSPR